MLIIHLLDLIFLTLNQTQAILLIVYSQQFYQSIMEMQEEMYQIILRFVWRNITIYIYYDNSGRFGSVNSSLNWNIALNSVFNINTINSVNENITGKIY